ncbi:hypothetical protein VaNZ11_013502, partial [Volvox africanus]
IGTAGASPLLPLAEMIGCEGNSLMVAVMKAPELVTLRSALNVAGLHPRLNNDRVNMTFFAPADGAFTQLAADSGVTLEALLAEPLTLRHLLLYHLLPGPVPPDLLVVTPAFSTYWAGENVYVTQPFQGVVVGESGTATRISKAVRVCGSYLYIVSHVLLPGPSLEALPPFIEYTKPTLNLAPVTTTTTATSSPRSCNPDGTILDVLRSNPDLSYTLGAIDTSRLTSLFNNASVEMTLLAPNDDAWWEAALRMNLGTPEEILGQTMANLRALVWAHVIPANLPPTKLRPQLYESSGGPATGPISVNISPGNLTMQTPTTDAHVVAMGLGDACNAAVYVVSRMLVPQQLPDVLKVQPMPTEKRK